MKFDINNYKGKYVMHCKTEAEAKEFCHYLHSIGRRWASGTSYHEITHWDDCGEYTYYVFNNGTYISIHDVCKGNYTILEWSDFTTEFTKADLKNGMIVEYNNGNRRLVLGDKLISDKGTAFVSELNEDLILSDSTLAINKVYKSNPWFLNEIFDDASLTLIWERKSKPEPVEMTLAEVCKALGKEIKIVKE